MLSADLLLGLILFLPALWALPLLIFNSRAASAMRYYVLLGSAINFGLTVSLIGHVRLWSPEIQLQVRHAWIPTWHVDYFLGVDGISLPLILLTSLIFLLAVLASWSIENYARGYLMLLLLLQTGVLGVFLSLDFFLFYVFWEVMLLPMYFLIGIWGGPRKEYAAIKFFLYTFTGGVLMLIAMLMSYFASGGSFDLIQLARIGQGLEPAHTFDPQMQVIAFALLLIAFAIKLPVFPFHTWLPDAHVEAPTPISMILAGILLKMGGYGLLRVAMPLFPYGTQTCAGIMVVLGVISILYGALAALAQTDFKRLVAYSSVSHMGYVLLGLGVWKVQESTGAIVGRDFFEMGVSAAVYQMVAHGITSAGMFFMVGVLYDRVHHRDLNQYGGLAALMPEYTALAAGLFFAGLGLPGLCGFIGEVFAVLSAWNYSPVLAVLAASGVVITAGYILWTLQRVYLGPEYRGPNANGITPLSRREALIGYTLLVFAVALGVAPALLMDVIQPNAAQLVDSLDQGYRGLHRLPTGAIEPVAHPR